MEIVNDLDQLRLTVVQMGAQQDVQANLAALIGVIESAPSQGSQLMVFPECILSGYMYNSLEEVRQHSVSRSGPEMTALAAACRANDVSVVVGFLEDFGDGTVGNSAIFLDESGREVTVYRKVHLPFLGADRYVTAGELAPAVVDTRFGRIGIGICYDIRFPESARSMALNGADLIVQPSTMPREAAVLLEHFVPVRAAENRVYVALANRADEEGGTRFIGRSQIIDPSGRSLAEASETGTQQLTVTVNLNEARRKRITNIPGQYEVSLFEDRRPNTYEAITSSTRAGRRP